MKKLLIIALLFVSFTGIVKAQEIGIRFGDALGANYAIDGIFALGKFSRVHADLAFGNGVTIEALYDFLYKPLGGEAFHWYAGFGISVNFDDPFTLGIPGEIGLEYHFNGAPIAIGADWRPVFVIVEETKFRTGGYGFNIRYVLGK
ncbi:MAG: outer membrane insertion C- signal [Bacteroidetes bacterium]|nr:MAG: outer membrane insertion C- signal [Bacteroidota bacterium]